MLPTEAMLGKNYELSFVVMGFDRSFVDVASTVAAKSYPQAKSASNRFYKVLNISFNSFTVFISRKT
jgi:hypothetical protein